MRRKPLREPRQPRGGFDLTALPSPSTSRPLRRSMRYISQGYPTSFSQTLPVLCTSHPSAQATTISPLDYSKAPLPASPGPASHLLTPAWMSFMNPRSDLSLLFEIAVANTHGALATSQVPALCILGELTILNLVTIL